MNWIIKDNELYHYGVKGMKWRHKKSAYNWRTDPRNYERDAEENKAAIKENKKMIADIKTGKSTHGTSAQRLVKNIKWNALRYKINKKKQANAAKAKNKKSKNARTR